MRFRSVASIAACLLICVAIMGAHKSRPTQDTEPQVDEIVSLLTQRRDVLAERHKWVQSDVRAGNAAAVEAIQSETELLDAELELATTTEARVTILRKHLQNATVLYEHTNAMYESGFVSRADQLTARAAQLAAEIRLARAERGDR